MPDPILLVDDDPVLVDSVRFSLDELMTRVTPALHRSNHGNVDHA